MRRSVALLLALAGLVASMWFAGGQIQLTTYCNEHGCGLLADSSLVSTIVSFGLLALLVAMPRREVTSTGEPVGRMRRFGAFSLDFFVLMLVLLPPLVLLVLGVEFVHTGEWTWTLQRAYPEPTDTWLLYGGISTLLLLVGVYFYRALRTGRATFGRYVAGYQIAPRYGEPGMERGRAMQHLLLSWLCLGIWPITLLVSLFNDGILLWDEATDTRAIRVERDES
jgi:hypothetical protein